MSLKVKPYNEPFKPSGEISWQILPVFLREMDTCLANLQVSVQNEDILQSREVLHQMIGATSIVGNKQMERLLTDIQILVKSNAPFEECLPFLDEIGRHLDSIFHFLMEERPSYLIQLYDDQKIVIKLIQEQLLEVPEIKGVFKSATMTDCISKLAANNADILVTDQKVGHTSIQTLSDSLSPQFDDLPILAFTMEPQVQIEELIKDCKNLSGYVNKCWGLGKLVLGIKTVANGRNFWPLIKE